MDLSKCVIINAAIGKWYPKGQQRLLESLRNVGYSGNIMTWSNEPINEYYDEVCPYTIKAAAFYEAQKAGYKHIVWLDCSIYAIREINSFFDLLASDAYYFWKSGWNLAQSSNDYAIQYYGYTRDEAEKLPECASSIIGLNMDNPKCQNWLELFLKSAKDNVFHGSRFHDNQSSDPRFKFHRQDQTAASFSFYKSGMEKMYEQDVLSAYVYDNKTYAESVYFLLKGM